MATADNLQPVRSIVTVQQSTASIIDDLAAAHESRSSIPRQEVTNVLPVHMRLMEQEETTQGSAMTSLDRYFGTSKVPIKKKAAPKARN